MAVSQDRGTVIKTPTDYNPWYTDPHKGTPNFWETSRFGFGGSATCGFPMLPGAIETC